MHAYNVNCDDEATHILDALGFAPTLDNGVVSVTVPNWRPDIEGTADLVEEVVRINGAFFIVHRLANIH